jgi:hypothetical protein
MGGRWVGGGMGGEMGGGMGGGMGFKGEYRFSSLVK